jgi:hypothetical protein
MGFYDDIAVREENIRLKEELKRRDHENEILKIQRDAFRKRI